MQISSLSDKNINVFIQSYEDFQAQTVFSTITAKTSHPISDTSEDTPILHIKNKSLNNVAESHKLALTMLKHWWSKATDEQKLQFKQSIND